MSKKIYININSKTSPTDFSWQFGLGADHAHQFHRNDVVEQLQFAHDELGIKQVRFHGIFNDDMFTYQTLRAIAPLPKGCPVKEVNFRQVAHVLDNILATGVKPFMELGFMPGELARGNKSGLKYKNNICPPKDYAKWATYLTEFIQFLFERYGKIEVESWYFEVWNEPDLKIFFAGTQKDYFRLYHVTAETLKRINPDLMVGGPSTSACRWISEFKDFCNRNAVPLDFISTHHYPGDGFGNLITVANYKDIAKTIFDAWRNKRPLGETLTAMFYNPAAAAAVPKDALVQMDSSLLQKTGNIPAIITEWNSMAIFSVPLHDEKYSAAFALKSVLDLDNGFMGYMFWCLSDIFEEQLQLNRPFIGGFGLLTVDGIPKPGFWAFKMLSQLHANRLEGGFRAYGDVDYAAFRKDNSLQILIYAQSNDPRENKTHTFEIDINCSTVSASVQIIDDTHCNPKREWEKLGSPDYLRPSQVRSICEKTRLKPEATNFECTNGKTIIRSRLQTNDIFLYTLEIEE